MAKQLQDAVVQLLNCHAHYSVPVMQKQLGCRSGSNLEPDTTEGDSEDVTVGDI